MYSKVVFAVLIITGIVFYAFTVLHAYQLVCSAKNNIVPLFEALSSVRICFRIESINITRIGMDKIRVLVRAVVNIDWGKKAPVNGPVFEILWMNNTVGKIEIKSLDEPVMNKLLTMEFIVREQNVGEPLYFSTLINTSIGVIKLIQPMTNISAILSQTRLTIKNICVERHENKNYLVFNITSHDMVKAPIKIMLLDKNGDILAENNYEDFYVEPGNEYKVFIDITGIKPSSIRYIKILVYGIPIALFKLRG